MDHNLATKTLEAKSLVVREWRKLVLSVLLAIAGYGGWVFVNEADAVFASAARVGGIAVVVICTLSLVNYALRFIRWRWYLGTMGHRIPVGQDLRIYLSGFALTTTPGKAGEAIRSLFLKEYEVPYTTSLAALAAERLADVISVAIIAVGGILFFGEFRWLALFMLLAAAMMILAVHSQSLRGALRRIISRMLAGRLHNAAEHAVSLLDRLSRLTGSTGLLLGICLGTVAWSAEAYGFWYLVVALGYDLPLLQAAAIYALSMLAGAASFMPGGLGGAEAAMGIMLLATGFSGADAVSATLICRLATLWFAVAIGVVALGVHSASAERKLNMAAEDKR
jgi:uncharacterized protein (TIRG00374 family)